MKSASLTNHALSRLGERSSLSQEEITGILDAGGGIPISLQKGGRHAHRLIYSPRDEDWFMVVQDGGDGGVLTVMPLAFLEGRTTVTAAQKRQARRKAIDAQDAMKAAAAPVLTVLPPPASTQPTSTRLWKFRVRYRGEVRSIFKMLPWVPFDLGGPEDWSVAGPIHLWLKERLVEAQIPIGKIESIAAISRKQFVIPVEHIMEHLPMTAEEIDLCR